MVKTADAYTIIGLKITSADLSIETIHQYELCCPKTNSDKFHYCPNCGTKNNVGTFSTFSYIDQYNDYDDDFYVEYGILTIHKQYKVFKIDEDMYISVHITACNDNQYGYQCDTCPLSLEELCVLKQTLMDDLCTIDRWKNDIHFVDHFNTNFKIYTISGCS